jgi:hypothetical protein
MNRRYLSPAWGLQILKVRVPKDLKRWLVNCAYNLEVRKIIGPIRSFS